MYLLVTIILVSNNMIFISDRSCLLSLIVIIILKPRPQQWCRWLYDDDRIVILWFFMLLAFQCKFKSSTSFRAPKLGVTNINRLQHPSPTSMKPLRLKPPIENDVKKPLLHRFTLPISMLAFANQNLSFSWLSF